MSGAHGKKIDPILGVETLLAPVGIPNAAATSVALSQETQPDQTLSWMLPGANSEYETRGANLKIRQIPVDGYETVVVAEDSASKLHALIAIHDTTLGPALGGCRLWNYDSEEEALTDVLRLSMGMTYKAAVAGLSSKSPVRTTMRAMPSGLGFSTRGMS